MLFPVKFRVALVALVVAGGGAAAVALGPAGPAVGQSSPPASQAIQLHVTANSPGTVVANGADVDVTVRASCSGQGVDSADVEVGLTESVNGDLASGYGSATVDCTGTTQTADIVVVAYTSSPIGAPTTVPYQDFTMGSAIGDTLILACNTSTYSCANQEVFPIIELRK